MRLQMFQTNFVRVLSLLLTTFVICSITTEANAITIKKCSNDAASDLSKAYGIISRDVTGYLNQWDGQVSSVNPKDRHKVRKKIDKYKRNFRKKLAKVKIVCKDSKKRCIKMGGADAFVKYEFKLSRFKRTRGNKVRVCYYKMAQKRANLCQLVGIIVHEMAHLVGVPKEKGHNKRPRSVRASDAVYLFGDSATSYCLNQASAGKINNSVLIGLTATNLDVGEDCTANSQCASGKCKGPSGGKICVCKNNKQCPSGICRKIHVTTPVKIKKFKQCLSQCENALQGKIAWKYSGSGKKMWNKANTESLCAGAENSTQPALCFQRIMHGSVNWGGGTRWKWQNAVDLCGGTLDANATISCFERQIRRGRHWRQAIRTCG